ncbi:MAG: amidohydrolase family protein, partial [Treponema sp.]|nr:amidohydrolase family protein [Treponema sp.]
EYLAGKRVWFDTSSSLWKLPLDEAKKIMKKHGIEKMLFGSDFPMWDHEEELEKFNRLDLTGEEREAILYKNAEKLLGLD